MKAVAIFMTASVLAAGVMAQDTVNSACKAMGDVAAGAAVERLRGVPKEGIDRLNAPDIAKLAAQDKTLGEIAQLIVDATYRAKWGPSEARKNVWTMCLDAYRPRG